MKQLLLVLSFLPATLLAQENYTLISNTNVVDVSSGRLLTETSVLIKDGLIEDVFKNKKFKLPRVPSLSMAPLSM
jgi:hypothetical protein